MRYILYPFSLIYGSITNVRNLLFDMNILKSQSHSIPIICIGNLSAGGNGKTPHTNYIAKLLRNDYKVAILSRGYGRISSGFHYVSTVSHANNVGDEPLQLKLNNPNCIVAVNNNRNKGVKQILKDYPETNVILLDDGFQHRWIMAGLNIIISPFYNPYYKNQLLPLGTLREHKREANRSDIIIISKTPAEITATEKKGMIRNMKIKGHQKTYFSSIKYNKFKCMHTDKDFITDSNYSIILVSGIANPKPLIKELEENGHILNQINFTNHYRYKESDIKKILKIYNTDKSRKKLILTTEKDAVKLKEFLLKFKDINFYYIPIEIKFKNQQEFDQQIKNYVAGN